MPGRNAPLALASCLIAAVSCRTAGPAPPSAVALPSGWQALRSPVTPFAALYRLDCCGKTGLVATVRGDGEHVALTVASPPLPGSLQVWLAPDGGAVSPNGGRCRELLAPGVLPVSARDVLRVEPRELAPALSGVLPADVKPSDLDPGWLVSSTPGGRLLWRVSGAEPRLEELDVEGPGGKWLATVRLSGHVGRVPGRVDLETARGKALLRLVEWHGGKVLSPPDWLASPPCAAKGT